MTDVYELMTRQAEWQKGLRDRSWAEKIRMAEKVRQSAVALSVSGLAKRRGRLGQSTRDSR